MPALSIETLFDTAAKIQVLEEKSIAFVFSESGISIRFPTTRRLADYLGVPHYYVLPFFAMMEQEALVTRAERVGILTTTKGTEKLVRLFLERYRSPAEAILGPEILDQVSRRIFQESGSSRSEE